MFGNWKKKAEMVASIDEKQPELTMETVVRFYVDNGFQLENGNFMRVPTLKKGQNEKEMLRKAVKVTMYSVHKTDRRPGTLKALLKKAEDRLELDRLENLIVNEVYSNRVEAARSRVMVKAIRAGLDRSEAFLSLMEKTNVPDILAIERWVDKSDAYQAYEAQLTI